MFNRKYGLVVAWIAAVLLLLAVSAAAQSILTQTSLGTGFIVSSDGYIITNKHVIKGATDITVKIGGKEYKAKVVDSLSDNDIALLKIDAHGLPTVMLGDSDKVGIGDTVYAIGCPAGVCGTITEGRVANLGISSKEKEGATLHDLIMTDLTTTHGSSGGPLLDDRGEVIGITTAGIVVQGETTGFGVSIPINQAIPLLERVPGFSTSQMGQSTRVLSLNEIRQAVGAGTLLVQAEIQRSLMDLLPREVLGRALVAPDGSGMTLPTKMLWNSLHKAGVSVDEVAEASNEIETKRGDTKTKEEIFIAIFKCSTSADSLRALTYFNAPRTWNLVYPKSGDPNVDLLNQRFLEETWANSLLQKSSLLLAKSSKIGKVTVSSVVTSFCCTVVHLDLPPYRYICPPPCNGFKTLTPTLKLWGFGDFAIDNLVFEIMYYSSIAGPATVDITSFSESVLSLPMPPSGNYYSHNCKRVGDYFIFSSANISVDYRPFLDNFDQVMTAVFHTLANQ